LAPPRRRDAERRRLDDRGPGLHKRGHAQRAPPAGLPAARGRRPDRARLDHDHLRGRMTTLAPVSVALKFGFLVVLYLFLLWIARSARRDLGGVRSRGSEGSAHRPPPADATGLHSASSLGFADLAGRA